MDGEKFFDPLLFRRCGGAVEQMFLSHRQHAARAGSGIVDGEMPVGDGNLQQLDHEADNFARGEVISCLLAALFRKAPEQFLVDVTHFEGGELVRAEREFLVLIQDRGEAVVLYHRADGRAVIEVLDNVLNVLGEAVDVVPEVFSE